MQKSENNAGNSHQDGTGFEENENAIHKHLMFPQKLRVLGRVFTSTVDNVEQFGF